MDVSTAWVKPPNQIGGLDHLAVQALCINIYGRLLPGITNVTDRARYYSFYPWLIWQFDQQGHTKYDDDFIERFRRADCLFSLISERHALTAGGDYDDHAGAMVGSNTLAPVARELKAGSLVSLSDYSLRSGAKTRYFKNKLGGLGQYYLGVLRELGILDGDAASGIKYTKQIGQLIAEQMDPGINGKLFFAAVDADIVTTEQLDALNGFCPCCLPTADTERDLLTEIYFARGTYYDPEALPRRRTLQSIIHLTGLLSEQGHELTESVFRACVYAGALPDGEVWECPETLVQNRAKWATYARNETLSIAIQGLFFALLDAYGMSGLRLNTGEQVVDWYLHEREIRQTLKDLGEQQELLHHIERSVDWLPAITEWPQPNHEYQLSENVVSLSHVNKGGDTRQKIVKASLQILIALASRGGNDVSPYGEIVFEEDYFRYYPINLRSFQFHISNTWSSLSLSELLRWLLLHWGVETHLKVALRKLRGQSQSTFRIRPSDRGLEVIGVPPAVHTTPRFRQAVRVLKDIGALEKNEEGLWVPSAVGQAMLELGDAP